MIIILFDWKNRTNHKSKDGNNTNCYSKCRVANFEFTMVNADRPTKAQIELSELKISKVK